MPLDYLYTSKSAQFFRPNPKRRLTNTAMAELVRVVAAGREGQFQDRRIREPHTVSGTTLHVTYVCYRQRREPSFLRGSPLREDRFAYIMIVEAPEAIALFKKNAEGIAEALRPFVLPWGYENLGGLYVDDAAAFERISLRAMSVGGNVVKRRSLEADDLASSMATAGIHRSIPNNFRTRGSSGTHTITPGSSRISRRDSRAGLVDLIEWVRSTGAELRRSGENYSASFLAEFCRALSLEELPEGTVPRAILFDLTQLRWEWEQAPGDYEFVLKLSPRSETWRLLNDDQVLALFEMAETVLPIEDDRIWYTAPNGNEHAIGSVRVNKNSISVRGDLLDRVEVRTGEVATRMSTYANQEGNFLITFNDPEFAYADGRLFKDVRLLGSIDSLLRIFEDNGDLARVTDEKAVDAAEFGKNGIFRTVEDAIVPRDAVLVCDDLGDEWADYISVRDEGTAAQLSFIHCKHGDVSTGASALQTPIGQAIKNLSRMFRPAEHYARKVESKWSQPYSDTTISRIRRGGSPDDIKRAFDDAIGNPNTQREVVLVISSVSVSQLREELELLKRDSARPHVSQLLWLLSNFVAACREYGVVARVVCAP